MNSLIGGPPKPNPESVARLKGWVADRFALAESAAIMVSEVRCQDSACPHVETVIAILESPGRSRRFNVMKPVEMIVEADVRTLETKG